MNYFGYIAAAYGIAGVTLAALIWQSIAAWRAAKAETPDA